MSTEPPAVGASVGQLLDQAEDVLYAIAREEASGGRMLAAWPAYAAACLRLTTAAVGARFVGHATAPGAGADPVLTAGLRLITHFNTMSVAPRRSLPEPQMIRAAQLIGAAADLIECAHDRPGITQREAAQADTSRSAGIIRAAELALTGVDLTIRACGRSHQQTPKTAPNSPYRLTARAAPLFAGREAAANVMDVAAGRPAHSMLDDVRVPSGSSAGSDDLLDRLHVALANWRSASLETVQQPAVSSAELHRATVEGRHLIAFAAAITDAARSSDLVPASTAVITMAKLQRAGASWSAATTVWTRFTTGVQPSQGHMAASLELQAAVRAITRAPGGAWLTSVELRRRVDVSAAALEAARNGLGDLLDVGRVHHEAVGRLIGLGRLYAPANLLPVTEDRTLARVLGKYVTLVPEEGTAQMQAYERAITGTSIALQHVGSAARGAATKEPMSASARLQVRPSGAPAAS